MSLITDDIIVFVANPRINLRTLEETKPESKMKILPKFLYRQWKSAFSFENENLS